jgi:hypothetical protein
MTDLQTIDYRETYGARETNGLTSSAYHYERESTADVEWTAPGLRITRLRLISDPGFPLWDVSYCHGKLNGADVDVLLPFSQLPKRGMRRAIVEAAKADGVFAKGIGILDVDVISPLV